jgi:hypothetical protein
MRGKFFPNTKKEGKPMKVIFKYGISTYSGTLDSMVYGSYRDGKLCIGREYVYPTLTVYNEQLGNVAKNLSTLYAAVSPEYKADLKTYAQRNGTENVPKTQLPPTAYALYVKMMYAWQASDSEHVDLGTITDLDVDTLGLGIVDTVKNCIDNDLLPAVSNYDDLTAAY